jgi:2-polyprenyl-3-methyl-5-hydroxy-6-metoxy-1,4-benzoquinol methylase
MLKIYQEYQRHGIDNYYRLYSNDYYNPHEEKIEKIYVKYIKDIIKETDKIIDIACGNGLISKLIYKYNKNKNISGCDPYFNNEYTQLHLSFEEIAIGKLNSYNKRYNIGFCSYAFHLLEQSYYYDFLTQLSLIVDKFIIITPSKKVNINHFMWNIETYIREDKITLIILTKIKTLSK